MERYFGQGIIPNWKKETAIWVECCKHLNEQLEETVKQREKYLNLFEAAVKAYVRSSEARFELEEERDALQNELDELKGRIAGLMDKMPEESK